MSFFSKVSLITLCFLFANMLSASLVLAASCGNGDFQACQKEAGQGKAYAQFNLGLMYQNGQGVVQDYKEAVRWYSKAANQGNAGAQFNLGVMYDNGQGVVQDYKEAVKWYSKAANQGFADAQNNLGLMYDNGQGVVQDYVKAHMWYNLSASNGSEDAAKNRGLLAKEMTPSQIEEALRLARDWKPKKE